MELQLLSFPVIFTVIIFLLMLKKIYKKSTNQTPNLPPGPRKLPIIGNMHQLAFGLLPHHRLRDLAKEYGSVMHLQLGETSNIVISSAEAAKEVMKTHDIIFAQRPFILGINIVMYNSADVAFAPYGDSWRKMKKICMLELLTAKRVQSFRPIREEEVLNFINEISASTGSAFNFSKKLYALTYTIFARASFGKKCKDQDAFIPLAEAILVAVSGFCIADLFPSFKLLPVLSGFRGKLERLSRDVDRIIENIILDHKSAKEDSSSSDIGCEDIVDVLLRVRDDLDTPLTEKNIKAILLDMFIAGSETSSTTLEWAMSELLRNPREMEKAQAEVRKVYKQEQTVDESKLHELKYMKLVIKETLRMHPAGPLLLPRESRESCEIGGYTIPEKTKVMVNAWAIARDPKYWNDPETFNPERFLDSNVDYKGNNFEFIPFGSGRRMCPGMLFGLANVELPLAQLLYHFDWKLANGKNSESLDMTEAFGATVKRKNDLHLIPIPYKPNAVGLKH